MGKWFCDDACVNDDKDLEELRQMEELAERQAADDAALEDFDSEGEIDL